MNSHPEDKHDRGLIQFIVIIVIAAVILSFFGLNPQVLWLDYAVPAIRWIWEVVFAVISFIIEIVVFFVDLFKAGQQ